MEKIVKKSGMWKERRIKELNPSIRFGFETVYRRQLYILEELNEKFLTAPHVGLFRNYRSYHTVNYR